MEAEVDEDDGTFTNISLADDTGKPQGQFRSYYSYYFFKVSPVSALSATKYS